MFFETDLFEMKIYSASVILLFTVLMSSCAARIGVKDLQKNRIKNSPSREVVDAGLVDGMYFITDKSGAMGFSARLCLKRFSGNLATYLYIV